MTGTQLARYTRNTRAIRRDRVWFSGGNFHANGTVAGIAKTGGNEVFLVVEVDAIDGDKQLDDECGGLIIVHPSRVHAVEEVA